MPRQLRWLPIRSAESGCRQRQLSERNLDFLLAWNLDPLSQPVRVAHLFADGPNVRPERLRQADEAGSWPHRMPFSSRRTNSWSETPTAWQTNIQARRPVNVAAVALANKMARMAWAILAKGSLYQKGYVSVRPA